MSSTSVYVVFKKAERLGWIKHLIHKEISHCFVMWPDKGRWIIYDHSTTDVSVFTVDRVDDIILQSLVIRVDDVIQTGWTWCLNTCVSSVKKMLGINNPFILTPFQLLKRLS